MSFTMAPLRAFLSVLVLVLAGTAVHAHSYKSGTLEIGHPWARETPAAAAVGAGYFKVKNTGTEPDRLIGAESDAAATVEMHESTTENGIAKMRAVTSIEIPAGTDLAFAPGGYHLMLLGLKEGLAEGMRIPAVLIFEKAGRIEVELAVESRSYGATKNGEHPPSGHAH